MPLARANTSRAKSRSPVPPASFQCSSPRTFLPPAHYRDAAGSKLPTGNSSPSMVSPSPATVNYSADRIPFLPVSYPSQSMSPNSSYEFKPMSDSNGLGTISPKSASGSRKKRQSNLGNLPLLEVNLLPSLRDTIDRMTRPPSRVSASTVLPSPASSFSSLQPPSGSARSLSPSFFSVSSADTFRPPSTPKLQSPSKSSSTSKSSSIPQPIFTTNLDPARGKQKSALKSALRSPTPKLSIPQPLATDLSLPLTDGSLRPAKGVSSGGRKTPVPVHAVLNTHTSPVNEAAGAGIPWPGGSALKANDKLPAGRNGRARSRTDPGVPPKLSISSPSSATVPQLNTFTSGLPRRLDPLPLRKEAVAYNAIDSSSEIEERYGAGGKHRRKLIVTNAAVVASSSSESDVDVRTPDKRTRLPVLSDRWTQNRVRSGWEGQDIGLGFGLEDGSGDKDVVDAFQDDDDERSVYDDDEEESGLGPVPHSIKLSQHSYQADDGENSRKRREALIGIVDGLDLGLGSAIDDPNEESDYCGQDGLAISGSGDVAFGVVRAGGGIHTEKNDSEDVLERLFETGRGNGAGRDGNSIIGNPAAKGDAKSAQSTPLLVMSMEDNHRRRGRASRERQCIPQSPIQPSFSRPTRPLSPCDMQQSTQDGMGNAKREKNRKSPSRSPVIRQSTGVPMPAALRRHSFYEGSPSMRPSSKLGTEYSDAEKDIVVDDQPHNQASDDAGLAESSYAAAARERKAFGIPASESDEVYRPGVAMLPHATSDLSSVGSTLWHEDCEELSMGAEELFRKLSGRQGTERDQCRSTGMDTECGSHKPFDTDDIISRELGLGTQISRSSGSSSNYEKDLTEPPWPPKQQENNSVIQLPSSDGTWRSSLSQREYESLHERHGEMEMHRQEVIWNFRETEELFVKQLLSMVRLFIRPLRAQNTNTWITGVPMDVARLLDWVEDIANLHTQILSVLQSTRHGQSPVVEIAAESLRSFVPRLEVYQPYLVRLEEVIATVTHLAQDQDSDFGEFVKIQERGSTWSLRSFLMEPQARLQQYLVIFRRLRDLTPKDHPDYLSTFALLHSTDLVIRVLNEVKNREDEYDLIKDISTRLQGLSSAVQLARRERRLLAHGLLQYTDTGRLAQYAMSNLSVLSSQRDMDTPKCSSKLVDAINEWDTRRGRSGSVKSNTSSSTAMSFKSYETTSSVPSSSPITPSSDISPYCRVVSPSQTSLEGSHYPKSVRQPHLRSRHPLAASPISQQNETLKPVPVHIFVFTDIVVLAMPLQNQRQTDRQEWHLLDDIGIARILGITEPPDSGPQIILDLLPVKAQSLEAGVILDGSLIVPVHLELPGTSPFSTSRYPSDDSTGDVRRRWLSAFRQCFQFALRSLSFPSDSDYGLNADTGTEQSVLSILASGLPLPKSPSAQIDATAEQYEDDKQQEREERGWWSLRFQQVLRELRQQSPETWAT